eukprot:598846-Pyramimonas_sp.AAC.1
MATPRSPQLIWLDAVPGEQRGAVSRSLGVHRACGPWLLRPAVSYSLVGDAARGASAARWSKAAESMPETNQATRRARVAK